MVLVAPAGQPAELSTMKQAYTYYLHRLRYRYFRRFGMRALAAWTHARSV